MVWAAQIICSSFGLSHDGSRMVAADIKESAQ
jgi:hypothetical protein